MKRKALALLITLAAIPAAAVAAPALDARPAAVPPAVQQQVQKAPVGQPTLVDRVPDVVVNVDHPVENPVFATDDAAAGNEGGAKKGDKHRGSMQAQSTRNNGQANAHSSAFGGGRNAGGANFH